MAPEGGVGGLGLSYKEEVSLVTQTGKYRGKTLNPREYVTTG